MKPTPNRDFPIVVRARHIDEYADAAEEIFAGVFDVYLNHQPIAISFVPPIRDVADTWPPAPPADTDALATVGEAREAVIALGDYIVTPSSQRAGEIDRLAIPPEDNQVTIFFVSQPRFDALAAELEELSNSISALNKGAPVSQLGTYQVAALIREIVLGPHFRSEDRALITPCTEPGSRNLDAEYVIELGAAYAPDSPWGLDRLRVQRDGKFVYENQFRDAIVKSRSGRLTAAALCRLADALETSGFPEVPPHDIPPGAANLDIASSEGRSAFLGMFAAKDFAGYGDIVAMASSWTLYLRTEPEGDVMPYGLVLEEQPQRGSS